MSITLGKYTAEGPFLNEDGLKNQSGVYTVLGGSGNGKDWKVVDVGETKEVRDRVIGHDRRPCWKRQGHSTLAYAAVYASEADRMRIEKELRDHFKPPCGDI